MFIGPHRGNIVELDLFIGEFSDYIVIMQFKEKLLYMW